MILVRIPYVGAISCNKQRKGSWRGRKRGGKGEVSGKVRKEGEEECWRDLGESIECCVS